MSVIHHAVDDEERESLLDEDENRSKKSMSIKSGVTKSIRKAVTSGPQDRKFQGSSKQDSQFSGSKRGSKITNKKEPEAPVPTKLDLPQRQLHSDNLNEQHFIELRNFLYKKQRQEHLAAKVQKGGGAGRGSIPNRPGQRMLLNDDLGGSTTPRVDREIMAEIGGGTNNNSPGPSSKQPSISKGGQQI